MVNGTPCSKAVSYAEPLGQPMLQVKGLPSGKQYVVLRCRGCGHRGWQSATRFFSTRCTLHAVVACVSLHVESSPLQLTGCLSACLSYLYFAVHQEQQLQRRTIVGHSMWLSSVVLLSLSHYIRLRWAELILSHCFVRLFYIMLTCVPHGYVYICI